MVARTPGPGSGEGGGRGQRPRMEGRSDVSKGLSGRRRMWAAAGPVVEGGGKAASLARGERLESAIPVELSMEGTISGVKFNHDIEAEGTVGEMRVRRGQHTVPFSSGCSRSEMKAETYP